MFGLKHTACLATGLVISRINFTSLKQILVAQINFPRGLLQRARQCARHHNIGREKTGEDTDH